MWDDDRLDFGVLEVWPPSYYEWCLGRQVEKADPLAFALWKDGAARDTVKEVSDAWKAASERAQNVCGLEKCQAFWRWIERTPRDHMKDEMIDELERMLDERMPKVPVRPPAKPVPEPFVVPF